MGYLLDVRGSISFRLEQATLKTSGFSDVRGIIVAFFSPFPTLEYFENILIS
jgi:hypothetical protein